MTLHLEALPGVVGSFLDADRILSDAGRVASVSPGHLVVRGLAERAVLGDVVDFGRPHRPGRGEVVSIAAGDVIVAPFVRPENVRLGDKAVRLRRFEPGGGREWLGRVVNALGDPIDGGPSIHTAPAPADAAAASATSRARVAEPFRTGVRVVDIFTPLCLGQRFGIFAGSGVGKSTLLGMLARADSFDAVVVALVGERSREVREFVDDVLGPANMGKAVVVASTSDEPAILRRRGPELAAGIATRLRSLGLKVLFIVDSLTRYAHALREVASAIGEPPVARGYPASVFADLPRLLEKAGTDGGSGSITAIVSVLVDGDDHNDPVADAARGILDGHLVLDRAIADEGRFPAVAVPSSLSRLADRVWQPDERNLVRMLRALVSRYESTRDLRMLGGWTPGQDPELDKAVALVPRIYSFLNQAPGERASANAFGDLLDFLKDGETARDRKG
jgi:flagellum-specific ATP synthase